MRSKVWWPGLDSDVTYMGSNLYGKRLHSMPKKYMEIWGGGEHLKSLKISNVPIILFKYTSYWSVWPFPLEETVISVINETSKWLIAAIVKDIKNDRIIDFLQEACAIFSFTETIVSDNEPGVDLGGRGCCGEVATSPLFSGTAKTTWKFWENVTFSQKIWLQPPHFYKNLPKIFFLDPPLQWTPVQIQI